MSDMFSKWVVTNKGDNLRPDVRARLVGCEVKGSSPSSLEFFSATPPLEALRVLIAIAAQRQQLALSFSDVRKAHLNGRCRRWLIVKLPIEAGKHGGRYVLLERSLYGTRDAAACCGMSRLKILFKIELPMVWPGILTALVLCFSHVLGEFGVVLMMGGNIAGETKTLSISIYDSVQAFDFASAGQMSLVLLLFAITTLALTTSLSRRIGDRHGH